MSDGADTKVAKWDPDLTRQIVSRVGPLIKRYFRAEVRDLDRVPAAGGALVVSNHSGGMFTPDVLEPVDVAAEFGPDPDGDKVDLHVRAVMQEALDELARERRFPVLG